MWRREREKDTGVRTQAENSEKLQGSIFVPSFQLKVPRTIVMKTDVKINVHIISAVIQAVHDRGLLPDPSPRVPKCFRVGLMFNG